MKSQFLFPRLHLILLGVLLIALIAPVLPIRVSAQEATCAFPFRPVTTPLTDLGNQAYVRMDGQVTEFTGGLYPNGSNVRPPEHEAAGLAIARQITPLDSKGNPDPKGSIVMISVGMSNTQADWFPFISIAHKNPAVNPRMAFINGAQGGQTADKWVDPKAATWGRVDDELARYNYTPEQVQVAWVKQVLVGRGDFPAKALALEAYLKAIAQNLKINYPNIRIVYFSSRTRSYAIQRGLSPEPTAFETGFSVKWLIEKQINGDPDLNFDPQRGEVKAPYLSWGPYLWIDGENPRSDGQVWTSGDLAQDCTHPSQAGAGKVANMLFDFFTNDTVAASWFRADAVPAAEPTATQAPPVPTSTTVPTIEVEPTAVLPEPTSTSQPVQPSPTPVPVAQQASTPVATYVVMGAALLLAGLGLGWFLFGRRR